MAALLGLGAWELFLLATGAVVVVTAASPPGQKAARDLGNRIAESLDNSDADTDAPPVPVDVCPPAPARPACPPCPPPPPPRIDRVPPSRPHWPCPKDHMHVFVMNQNPVTCQCFPAEDQVICL